MTETEAIRLFKCLSDKSRLQILKSLAIEDMYVERLAERLGITAPTVSFHLKKLADALSGVLPAFFEDVSPLGVLQVILGGSVTKCPAQIKIKRPDFAEYLRNPVTFSSKSCYKKYTTCNRESWVCSLTISAKKWKK